MCNIPKQLQARCSKLPKRTLPASNELILVAARQASKLSLMEGSDEPTSAGGDDGSLGSRIGIRESDPPSSLLAASDFGNPASESNA